MVKNYYQILGLKDFESNSKILEFAYRKAMEEFAKFDTSQSYINYSVEDINNFINNMKDIKEAYETLSDSTNKSEYDAKLRYPALTEKEAIIETNRRHYIDEVDKATPIGWVTDSLYINKTKETLSKVNNEHVMRSIVEMYSNIQESGGRTGMICYTIPFNHYEYLLDYIVKSNNNEMTQIRMLAAENMKRSINEIKSDECFEKTIKFLYLFPDLNGMLSEIINIAFLIKRGQYVKPNYFIGRTIGRKIFNFKNRKLIRAGDIDNIINQYIDHILIENEVDIDGNPLKSLEKTMRPIGGMIN